MINTNPILNIATNVLIEDRCVMEPMVWCITIIAMHRLIKKVNGYVLIVEGFISL